MNFEIGDTIYKKKYHGCNLLTDYSVKFIILNYRKIQLSKDGCIIVVALLNDNTEFEIIDENMNYYIEKAHHPIFCCCI
jgi:hypothetical protein